MLHEWLAQPQTLYPSILPQSKQAFFRNVPSIYCSDIVDNFDLGKTYVEKYNKGNYKKHLTEVYFDSVYTRQRVSSREKSLHYLMLHSL